MSVKDESAASEAPRRIKFILILLLLAAVAVSYGNSIYGSFVFDDYYQIVDNPYIKSIKNIPAIFMSGFSHLNITAANYYRPILEVSYIKDRFLYGTWAAGYHITSILIHMLCTVVLFLLTKSIFRNIKISFLTALLFGVHPIYTSAVTYLSGRGDSMVILFILSSFLFYVKYLQSPGKGFKYLVPAIFSLFLALLTKETALFFVVVLFLYRYCQPSDQGRGTDSSKWVTIYVSAVTAVVIYLFMRSAAVTNMATLQYSIVASSEWHVRFFTFIRAFLNYLALLIFPSGLHFERTIPLASSLLKPDIILSLVVLTALIFAAIKLRSRKGPVFCGIMWFFLNLMPVSNIFIPLNAYIAENWIQLPAIGIFLAVSSMAVYFSERKTGGPALRMIYRMTLPAIILLAAFYSYLTISRNEEYRDPIVFYESALKYEPGASKLYNNLGMEIEKRRGDTKKSSSLYKKAIEADPANVNALNNLANRYSADGRFDEAIELFNKGLEVDKNNVTLLNNLGVTYIRKGDKGSALNNWRRSAEINPDQPMIKEYITRNE